MALLPTQRQTRGLKRVGVQQKAGNYISTQAQLRMLDLSRVSAEKWINSIMVEGFDALYFNAVDAGNDCSCRGGPNMRLDADADVLDSGIPVTPKFSDTVGDSDTAATFTVTKHGAAFGWGDADSDVQRPPLEESLVSDTPSLVGNLGSIDELFEDGADCGICHRRGLQPGYELLGHDRKVLSSLNLNPESKCTVINDQPDVIEVADGGFAEWTIQVPRYYQAYSLSVHSNHDVVGRTLYLENDNVLTPADLESVRGLVTGIKVRCTVPEFTHVVVSFKMHTTQLKVSLPQLQKIKDYRKFLAIPVATLVIPNTQPRCDHGDIVVIPKLQLMWKVSEVTPLTIVDGYQVGWSVQARVVQPNENLWSIVDRHMPKSSTD